MGLIEDSYVSFVNLDHRHDRLAHITGQLSKIGLVAERTRGLYPHEFDVNDPRHQTMRRRTIGAIGCYTSQLNVMKKALELGKHALVLEDDVVFCSDFFKRVEYIDSWHKTHSFETIWFGGTFHVGKGGPYWHTDTLGRDVETTDDPRLLKSYGSFSTYAYLVHRDTLRSVIDKLEEIMPRSIGIDWSFIQLAPQMNNYVFVPGCCKQIDNESDQRPGSGEWTVFSGFAKLGPYWFQDKMEDFDPMTYDWAEARVR